MMILYKLITTIIKYLKQNEETCFHYYLAGPNACSGYGLWDFQFIFSKANTVQDQV